MTNLIRGLILLVGALVAILFFAPMLIPADVIKQQIEEQATKSLGRTVTVAGEPAISFLPPKATVEGLTIANADGFSAPYFVKVEKADVGLRLFPLFAGEVDITTFQLTAPDIRLQTNRAGQPNWLLGPQDAPDPTPTEAANAGNSPSLINDVRLGDVRLLDGTVIFETATGETYTAEDTDIVLTLNSLDEPLGLKGTMTVQGEPSTIDASFTTPRSFAETQTADMALVMAVGTNKADTKLRLEEGLTFGGDLDIDFPALRALIALTGNDLDTPNGFQSMRFVGPVTGNPEKFAFGDGTQLAFDDIAGTGAVTIDLSGTKPSVSGNIAVEALNLLAYLPEESAEMQALKQNQAEGAPAAFPPWPTDILDFSALGSVDTDLTISAQQVLVPSLTIGPSAVNLAVQNGRAVATISQMSLYGGEGTGKLVMNAASRQPSMTADFTMTNINAGDFAQALLGINRLRGTGDVTFDVRTSGNSQAAFVQNLNGTVTTDLSNGAVEGINLGQLARGAYQTYTDIREGGLNLATVAQSLTQLTTAARGPSEETDFTGLNVNLGIRNGVVTSNKIALAGPYYDIEGAASINLPAQTMVMKLTPAVSQIDGSARRALPVPIQVSGTFNAPKVGIDAQPLVQSAASGAVKNLLGISGGEEQSLEDALREKAQGELGKLLGTSSDDETSATDEDEEEEKLDPKEELLKQGLGAIFGGKDD